MDYNMESGLKQRFSDLWKSAKAAPALLWPTYNTIIGLYSAPGRYYHNLEHISDCLKELDSAKHLGNDSLALEFAIWYHDIIYNPAEKDNEEMSAAFAAGTLRQAGMYPYFASRVSSLILDTIYDHTPITDDGKLMADIDLSSLGYDPDKFDQNSRNIRKEYAEFSDSEFDNGRIAALEDLLRREGGHIYSTDFFRNKYEKMAASNMIRSLNRLKGLDEDF